LLKHQTSKISLNTLRAGDRPTIYSYFDFGLKNSSLQLPYQHPSSSTDCARELLNGSNWSPVFSRLHSKLTFGWGVLDFLRVTS